jgi:hypothetical protein
MTRATLTAKMALTAKMRDCSRFMAWITLTAKKAANAVHKKSRTQFWLSDHLVLSIICGITVTKNLQL